MCVTLAEIPKNVIGDLEILPVKWIDEVLEKALVSMPTPIAKEESKAVEGTKKESEQESNVEEVKPH